MADLIDGILAPRRIHLLGGVSDAGKTSWVVPMLLEWEQGKPVLGHPSNPVPWVYIAGDRLLDEVDDKFRQLQIPPGAVRIIPATGREQKTWVEMLLAASCLRPLPELIVIEGFSELCGTSKREVVEFFNLVGKYCQGCIEFPKGITILGVVESPKLKPYETYPNPRQRISGVSTWSYKGSTVFLIEATEQDPALQSDARLLWVCPKSRKRERFDMKFDSNGKLERI